MARYDVELVPDGIDPQDATDTRQLQVDIDKSPENIDKDDVEKYIVTNGVMNPSIFRTYWTVYDYSFLPVYNIKRGLQSLPDISQGTKYSIEFIDIHGKKSELPLRVSRSSAESLRYWEKTVSGSLKVLREKSRAQFFDAAFHVAFEGNPQAAYNISRDLKENSSVLDAYHAISVHISGTNARPISRKLKAYY